MDTRNLQDLPLVLTVPEFAKLMRIGRSAAYEYVEANKIPSIRIGRTIRIPRSAVEQCLERTQ